MAVGVGYSSVEPAIVEQVGSALQVRYNVVPPVEGADDQSYRYDYVEVPVSGETSSMALYFSSVSEIVKARHAMAEEVGILRKTLSGVIAQLDALVAATGAAVPPNVYAHVFAGYHEGVESVKASIKQELGLS